MLDLLLLAIISFLVARVIWNFFGVFQSFFAYLLSKPIAKSTTQQQSTISSSNTNEQKKPVQKPNLFQGINDRKQKKEEKSQNSPAFSKKVVKEQGLHNQVLDKKQPLKLDQSTKVKAQKREDLFPIRLQEIFADQKRNPNNYYQMRIKELQEQISLYKKEQQKYIQTIEEIQQEIVNGTDQQNRSPTQDNQTIVINNLRQQLDAAKLTIQQQKDLFIKEFAQQKQLLRRDYQERIQNQKKILSEKTQLYETTINEVSQKIQELQTRRNEQNIQQSSKVQAENQLQLQKYQKEVQGLQRKLQELNQESNIIKIRYEEQNKSLAQGWQRSKLELKNLKEQLSKNQNDNIEYQTKYGAQIESLQNHVQELSSNLQNNQTKLFITQQQNEELKSKLQSQEAHRERTSKELSSLQQKFAAEMNAKQQLEKKLQQTLDQLQFCQQQLNQSKQTETDLKKKLTAVESPKKTERTMKKEEIQNSPQYISLKMELQRLKRKLAQKQQIISRSKTPENQQRELSPSFPLEAKTAPKRFTPSPLAGERKMQQTSPYSRPISTRSPSHVGLSTILSAERRSNTPAEKQLTPISAIIEGGIRPEVYLGQTQILDEAQRNIIVHEVSAVKKITVKKTRLMFSLKQKSNKSIHEFILGAPNIILIAELQNNKIVGAFTQNAFSRENKFTKSSIVSKAMIFDVSRQVFITNEGQGEIIRCQENALVWGNKEFVVNCQQPISISVNLNCQNSIYPSNYSTIQFLDSEKNAVQVSKLQIHRVFLG